MKKIVMKEKGSLTLKEGFEKFLQRKRIANLSEETLDTYSDAYNVFTKYISAATLCGDLDEDAVLGFIPWLRQRNSRIRDTSINSYLRGVRAWLYFCMNNGLAPRFKIGLVSAEKKIKETYSTAELEKLLKKPNINTCSFTDYRNWVIVCYLLGTGNRARTLCNVKIGDLDFETHEIKLLAVKNKRSYIIPLSRTLERTLSEYLEYRKGDADDYLFCNQYGQQLTYETLKTAIKRYNNSHGIAKTSLHLFRHTFAKNWILNNGDMFRLQKILGHKSIEIVKEYVDMFGQDLQRDFEQFNPLDNLEIMKKNAGIIKMGK